MDREMVSQGSPVFPQSSQAPNFYPDLAFLSMDTFQSSISARHELGTQDALFDPTVPSAAVQPDVKPIAVPTDRPINILLANGKLVRLPNLQSLFASARRILQRQGLNPGNSVNNHSPTSGQDSLVADFPNDAVNKAVDVKTEMVHLRDPKEGACNDAVSFDETELIRLMSTDKFKKTASAKLRYLSQQMEQTGFDDTQTIAAALESMSSEGSQNSVIDGIDLAEIRDFARMFKYRRLALGLTQTQVGHALTATKGPAYSQSAICRFEKLDITPKSAGKIKPVLEKWLKATERKYGKRQFPLPKRKNGTHSYVNLVKTLNPRKRKRRTSFSTYALGVLNESFLQNTHPSGFEMTTLSNKLHYDREVIRVWFCNKRQAMKIRMAQMSDDQGGGVPASGGDLVTSDSYQESCSDDNASSEESQTGECAMTSEGDCGRILFESVLSSPARSVRPNLMGQLCGRDNHVNLTDETRGRIKVEPMTDEKCPGRSFEMVDMFLSQNPLLNPEHLKDFDEITFADAVNEATGGYLGRYEDERESKGVYEEPEREFKPRCLPNTRVLHHDSRKSLLPQ